jgi:hypothetical protein
VIWDRTDRRIHYIIGKRVGQDARTRGQLAFRLAATESASSYGNYYETKRRRGEPFALLHSND